jgi:hypothetical protein
MSPRWNWDSPTPSSAGDCDPPPQGEGVREWGSPNSDDWRKSLALCLLCGLDPWIIFAKGGCAYVAQCTIKPRQYDQHCIHLEQTDERKCTVLYGKAENLCLTRGRILGRNPEKSLESFSPCYSQSHPQLCLRFLFLQTHATSYSFGKGERRKT